jgi:hypothetical protein
MVYILFRTSLLSMRLYIFLYSFYQAETSGQFECRACSTGQTVCNSTRFPFFISESRYCSATLPVSPSFSSPDSSLHLDLLPILHVRVQVIIFLLPCFPFLVFTRFPSSFFHCQAHVSVWTLPTFSALSPSPGRQV